MTKTVLSKTVLSIIEKLVGLVEMEYLQDIIFDEDDLNEAMMDVAKQCGIQKDRLTGDEIDVYKKYSNLIIRKVAASLGLPRVS
ncbi:MAG TPA: hypothetical protein P5509_03275 [Bacteroidales bacterium]|nr:hypothetical protein [Bacteroidales bacterium]